MTSRRLRLLKRGPKGRDEAEDRDAGRPIIVIPREKTFGAFSGSVRQLG